MFSTCPNEESRKSKNQPRQNKLGQYTLLLVNMSDLYISTAVGCRRATYYKTQTTTDRIPKLPTDRHFLELSETCLYMVHQGLGPCLPEVAKIVGTQDYLKSNPKYFYTFNGYTQRAQYEPITVTYDLFRIMYNYHTHLLLLDTKTCCGCFLLGTIFALECICLELELSKISLNKLFFELPLTNGTVLGYFDMSFENETVPNKSSILKSFEDLLDDLILLLKIKILNIQKFSN